MKGNFGVCPKCRKSVRTLYQEEEPTVVRSDVRYVCKRCLPKKFRQATKLRGLI